MSSAKSKLSFSKSLQVWNAAEKATSFDRWLESDLMRLEAEFPSFITVQSTRRAAQATMAEIAKAR